MPEDRNLPTPIRLLVLGGSPHQTEMIRAFLRNGGLAVYVNRVTDLTMFAETIKTQIVDVLLCHMGADPLLVTQQVLEIIHDLDRDLPVLLLFDTNIELDALYAALRVGARDLIPQADLERLHLVIVREFYDLQRRRELTLIKQRLREMEQQYRDWMEHSQEAIAFFQDGLHVQSNPAYAQLFGFTDEAEMEALPLLDSIEPAYHKALRAALKILSQDPRRQSLHLNVEAHRQTGESLHLHLQLRKARLDSQPSVQVIFHSQPASAPAIARLPAPHSESPRPELPTVVIEDVLKEGRLRLMYQPIVSLRGDTREHYAVLPCMRDDERAEAIETLLNQARQQNKAGEIDRWVIRRAILILSEQRQQGRRMSFLLQLSEESVRDNRLLLWICDGLRECNARGSWLTFAISEPIAHTHLPSVIKLTEGLKKIKCQIALDQFTLSPQALALLNYLEVDMVRLAPSLFQDLTTQLQRQDAIKQFNARQHPYSVKTIVSMGADAQGLNLLWSLGCAYIQGYFPGPPIAELEYNPMYLNAHPDRALLTTA